MGRGGALPCVARLRPGDALAAWRAESGQDPIHLGSLPIPAPPDGERLRPGPPRASPGGERLRPSLRRSAAAWQRGPALDQTPPEWAFGPTQTSPGRGGCALPYVARPLPGDAFAAWPRLPAREGAGAGPKSTRVGSRLDPGFAQSGVAAPPPQGHLRRLALARRPLCRLRRAGRYWAGPHPSGLPARPGLRPLGRACALPCVAQPLHGDAFGAA